MPDLGYREQGQGEVVVLIPGLGGLGSFWQPVAQALAPVARTLAVDHPGLGASAPCDRHSIPALVAGVLQLLDHLQIARCTVVGHSTGGLAAQALALDHADRVHAVVLSSTWARPDRRFRDLFRLRQQVLRHAGPQAYQLLGNLLGYPPDWYERHLASAAPPCFDGASAHDDRTVQQRIDMLLGYTRADDLHRLRQPTLVLAAPDDGIVPIAHAQALQAAIPPARLATLEGGHFTPVTRTRDYAELLQQFRRETA